jgi:hypothetical protein
LEIPGAFGGFTAGGEVVLVVVKEGNFAPELIRSAV